MSADTKQERTNTLWPAIWLVISLALGLAGCFLFYLNRNTAVPASWGAAGGARNDIVGWFNTLQMGLVVPLLTGSFGYLIQRQKVVPYIGRLFLALSLLSAAMVFISELTIYSAFTRPTPLPGTEILAWVNNFAWIFLFALALYLLAIFPNGRFLSSRWRRLILGAISLYMLPSFVASIIEATLSSAFQIQNPFFSTTPEWLYSLLFIAGSVMMLLSVIVVLVAVLVRFYRSQGRERQQMKWLLTGTAVLALMVSGGFLLRFVYELTLGEIMVNAGLLGPLVGVGMALVRHQLYDIDIIIRRTLLYTAVSATLALVYFGSILLLQAVFSSVVAERSPLVVVISTLVSAALFNPLRQRLQTIIDRRFFRQKYDAQQTLARFATVARDEVDMSVLTTTLLRVVDASVQPETVSLIFVKKET